MLENYLIVHKSILPDYYYKVLDVRHMLESASAKDVSTACKEVGISRSTYYKYKDYILEPSDMAEGRKAALSVALNHEPGVLSSVLSKISEAGCSVLTITQSLPIRNKASVTLSLDVTNMKDSVEALLREIGEIPGTENPRLLAIE